MIFRALNLPSVRSHARHLRKELVQPDIFNLGVAPEPPKSAHRFAQRVRWAPPYALDTLVARDWGGTNALVLNAYYLPPFGLAGTVTIPPYTNMQLPNPYQTQQW